MAYQCPRTDPPMTTPGPGEQQKQAGSRGLTPPLHSDLVGLQALTEQHPSARHPQNLHFPGHAFGAYVGTSRTCVSGDA
eukprot:5452660-Amphidinium_carterae.1